MDTTKYNFYVIEYEGWGDGRLEIGTISIIFNEGLE